MVTVKSYSFSLNNTTGEQFISLTLQGDLEMVKAQDSGKMYATTRKCKIPSTFDEETANSMIGKTIEGKIIKVNCEPYKYEIEDGTTIVLHHTYEYSLDMNAKDEEPVKTQNNVAVNGKPFSSNGTKELVEA